MKAVLVMDMPEEVCQKCVMCYESHNVDYMCVATGKEIPDREIPSWCPLKPLPEKKQVNQTDQILWGANIGYNACIDEMLKGVE